jgi:hypothetical protein
MAYLTGYTGSQNPILSLGKLDFTDIKSSIKDYLKATDTFNDYDFEASALSTLLDVLSYNSTMYGFYANMIANESFLDTAAKRESINSLVKPLSYVPSSRRSPRAEVVVTGTGQTINFGDLFTGNGYQWTPDKSYYVNGSTVITLLQGNRVDRVAGTLYDRGIRHQKFKIPNAEIDTSTLKVHVDEGNGYSEWTRADDSVGNISGFTAGTSIYYLTGSSDGGYEIYFGDGVLGKLPEHQSQIRFEYLATSGADSNNTASFVSRVNGVGVLSTRKVAVGGSGIETLESIKENAPNFFQTQGRAVTKGDFEVMIEKEMGTGIQTSVWGGEENDPPNYGRVFVSAVSNNRRLIADSQREEILGLCNEKSVVSIVPEFLDPVLIDIRLSGQLTFDADLSYKTVEEIDALITQYTRNYPLRTFNDSFRISDYIAELSEIDSGIVGENIQMHLSRTYSATEDEPVYSLTIPFKNAIRDPEGQPASVVESLSPFRVIRDETVYLVRLYDDGLGRIEMWDTSTDNNMGVIGSVNYENGRIQINNLGAIENFTIQIDPRLNLISAKHNLVLTIKDPDIEINRIN